MFIHTVKLTGITGSGFADILNILTIRESGKSEKVRKTEERSQMLTDERMTLIFYFF